MAAELLLVETSGEGVRTVTLNNPASFNALSSGMIAALHAALDASDADLGVRVVVIKATGRAFCAGHNLKDMLAANTLASHRALFAQCSRLMMCITSLSVPVVAAVQGVATAAGCQLVAQCDLALASTDARFAVSGVNLGLFCATPSVALSRNVGRKAAMEMLLTGEFIDAHEAQKQGLINRVATAEAFEAEVARLCSELVAKPRATLAMGKAMFYQQLEMGVAGAYQLAGEAMACNMMDASAQAGVGGFVNKRKAGAA